MKLKLVRAVDVKGLEEVYDRLKAYQKGCEDVKCKVKDLEYLPNGLLKVADAGTFDFTQWSFGQLCTRLKLPTDFLRRSPVGEGPASQKAIFDYWKENYDDGGDRDTLVRIKRSDSRPKKGESAGRVRAVLTGRFTPFDNLDLVAAVDPLMKKHGYDVKQIKLTDTSFHLRMLNPNGVPVGLKSDGEPDIHRFGFHVQNSEVGASNLTGDVLLYRLVCKNGMIALTGKEHALYARHMGIKRTEIDSKIEEAFDLVGEREADIKERLIEYQEPFEAKNESAQLGMARREIRSVLSQARMSKDVVDSALEQLDRDPVGSRFGVIQAITAAARKLPIDHRVALESIAGRYLLAA